MAFMGINMWPEHGDREFAVAGPPKQASDISLIEVLM